MEDYNLGVIKGEQKPPTCYSCKHYLSEGYWAEGHFKYRACMLGHDENVKMHHPPVVCQEFTFSRWRNKWCTTKRTKIPKRQEATIQWLVRYLFDADYQIAFEQVDREYPGMISSIKG